jgi:EmrB/QacA subfamily drug resistance transporter
VDVGVAGRALQRMGTEPRRPRWVRTRRNAASYAVATVCIGAFMGQLDASIVTVALPSVQRDFGASVGAVAWVGLGYLVALVASVVAVGRLSDMLGRKLLYVYGFGVFVVGSALCAVAPSLGVLIACRVLQGLGAAMLQANSVAIIALAVPRERLRRSIGIQGAAQAMGLAAGPTVGGLLLAAGGWRLLFLVNVPTGLCAVALGVIFLPRSAELRARSRLDVVGLATMVPAIGAALCALTLSSGAIGTPLIVALALGAVVLGWAFVAHERRAVAPLVELALLRSRTIALGMLGTIASYAVLFGVLLSVPFYLERGLHVGVALGGIVLAVMPAAMGLAAVLAGHATTDRGPRVLTVGGMLGCTTALGAMTVSHSSIATLAVELGVLGCGLGLFTPPNNASVVAAVPRSDAGVASGLLNMGRGLGTAVGLAVTSLVLGLAAPSFDAARGAIASGFTAAVAALTLVALLGVVLAVRAGREHGVERSARAALR